LVRKGESARARASERERARARHRERASSREREREKVRELARERERAREMVYLPGYEPRNRALSASQPTWLNTLTGNRFPGT